MFGEFFKLKSLKLIIFRIEVVVLDSIYAQFSWFGMRYTGTLSLIFINMSLKNIFSFNFYLKIKNLKKFQDCFGNSMLVPPHNQIKGEVVTLLVKIAFVWLPGWSSLGQNIQILKLNTQTTNINPFLCRNIYFTRKHLMKSWNWGKISDFLGSWTPFMSS